VAVQFASPDEHPRGVRVALLAVFAVCAIVLQTALPLYFSFLTLLDLPLLVVIYFALAFGSPVAGMFVGAAIGVAKDTLSRDVIGVFGIADTVVGYVTSTLRDSMDTEHAGIRALLIFALYWLQLGCIYLLDSFLLSHTIAFEAGRNLVAAVVNSVFGVLIFGVLDRFKKPA
jgi:rod shape-determining protein MreD